MKTRRINNSNDTIKINHSEAFDCPKKFHSLNKEIQILYGKPIKSLLIEKEKLPQQQGLKYVAVGKQRSANDKCSFDSLNYTNLQRLFL